MAICPVVVVESISPIAGSDLKWVVLVEGKKELHYVVTGDHYEVGQLGFFIPEGATVPEKLLREMWLWNEATNKGRLGGKKGDRVKARVLDGLKSEGLFYGATYVNKGERVATASWNPAWKDGDDVTAAVGITIL